MLKLKLQYFGHLMRRVDSLEKTLILGGIGGRRKEEPMQLKVGDIVIFSRYGGNDLKHKGVEYTIINQKDILATIEK